MQIIHPSKKHWPPTRSFQTFTIFAKYSLRLVQKGCHSLGRITPKRKNPPHPLPPSIHNTHSAHFFPSRREENRFIFIYSRVLINITRNTSSWVIIIEKKKKKMVIIVYFSTWISPLRHTTHPETGERGVQCMHNEGEIIIATFAFISLMIIMMQVSEMKTWTDLMLGS